MLKEELLEVVNFLSDDDVANIAHHTRNDSAHRLIVMTYTGIAILHLNVDGDIVKATDDEEDELVGIGDELGIVILADGERHLVTFDDDCDIVRNDDDVEIEIENVNFAGSMEELEELVENGDEDSSVFEALDKMEIMLG